MTLPLDPRLHAVRPDLADERLRGRVEASAFVTGRAAYVAVPLADLRRRPGADAPLETQALQGEAVRVFEEGDEGWSWVQLDGDGYVGWMPTMALVDGGPPAPTHRVVAPRTFVFPGPDIKKPPMHDLPMGAVVAVRGEAEDHNATYALIEPFGAVVRQHLDEISETTEDFVAVAECFLRVPYLWGGKSMLGIDCSGLVQLALAQCGIPAPRDTDLQFAGLGQPVASDEAPRRGDLVFWRGHVGIMMDEVRLLHANAHHMMTAIEPLGDTIARMNTRGVGVAGRLRLTGDDTTIELRKPRS